MAVEFYLHSYTNRQRDKWYDFSDNKMYINRIQSSQAYKNFFNEFNVYDKLDRMIHQHQFYFTYNHYTLDFYGLSGLINDDLHLSIGACKVKVNIRKIAGPTGPLIKLRTYLVTVTLFDEYNYEWWDESKQGLFAIFANNILGYGGEAIGLVVPYKWKIDISYIYYYVCPHGA